MITESIKNLLGTVGLNGDMTIEELRAIWTPELAVEIARLDGRGPRVGAVNSIDCALGTAVLRGADLRGVDLRGACLDRVCAIGADFREADLRGASLRQARLDGASFSDADLRGSDLYMASLEGAEFIDARLDGANLAFARVHEADFDYANGVIFDATVGEPLSYDLVNLRSGPCGA